MSISIIVVKDYFLRSCTYIHVSLELLAAKVAQYSILPVEGNVY